MREDLDVLPHVVLASHHTWNPQKIDFPKMEYSVQEEAEKRRILELVTFPTKVEVSMVDRRTDDILDIQEIN